MPLPWGRCACVLVSTYELGHQPLHVASPAGALLRAGHDVRCVDLSVDPFDVELLSWADAVACSVPMHTAMRLARPTCREIRARRPDVALCLYGLYAGLDGAEGAAPVADLVHRRRVRAAPGGVGRRARPGAGGGAHGRGARLAAPPRPHRRRARPGPLRRCRPAISCPGSTATPGSALGGERRLAGYVEASHGCAHRCRHCPVPVVYDGRTRARGRGRRASPTWPSSVAWAPATSPSATPTSSTVRTTRARVVDAVHGAFPELTFDVTAKVEHILRHRDLWPALARGRLPVRGVGLRVGQRRTSSAQLDKGHSAAEAARGRGRAARGGHRAPPVAAPLHPVDDGRTTSSPCSTSWLAATSWATWTRCSTPSGCSSRPVRCSLTSGRLDGLLDGYDDEHLGWSWRAPRPPARRAPGGAGRRLAERAAAEEWPAPGVLRRGARRRRRRHSGSRRRRRRRLLVPDAAAVAGPGRRPAPADRGVVLLCRAERCPDGRRRSPRPGPTWRSPWAESERDGHRSSNHPRRAPPRPRTGTGPGTAPPRARTSG